MSDPVLPTAPAADPALPAAPPAFPSPDALKKIVAQLGEQSSFQMQQLEAIAEGKAGCDAVAQVANARGWVQGALWVLEALGIDIAAARGAQVIAEINAEPTALPTTPVDDGDEIAQAHAEAFAAHLKEQEVGRLMQSGMAMNDALRLSDEERKAAVAKLHPTG